MTDGADRKTTFPSLILGGNVFGWSLSEEVSFSILDASFERGLTTVDTADVYAFWGPGNSGGESETIIGKWLKNRRKAGKVTIHTKGGAPGAPGEFANAKLDAAYLNKAIDGSLRRLGAGHIDLYYVHYDDKITPTEETLRVFERAISEGKIGAIAASNYSPERLADALNKAEERSLPRFCGLQTLYNLYDRQAYETELEILCVKRKLPVLTYFSLASGFLTGKYRSEADLSRSATRGGDVKNYLNQRGLRILDALDRVSVHYQATPAQISLAWLMSRPSIAAPVASATSIAQLDGLIGATKIKLDDEAIRELDAASRYVGVPA